MMENTTGTDADTSSGFLTTRNKYLLGAAMGGGVVLLGVAGLIIWILCNRRRKQKGRRRSKVGDPDPSKVEGRSSKKTPTDIQSLLKEEKRQKPKTSGRKKSNGRTKTPITTNQQAQNKKESDKNWIEPIISKSDTSRSEKEQILTRIKELEVASTEMLNKNQELSPLQSKVTTAEPQTTADTSFHSNLTDDTEFDSIVCEEPEIYISPNLSGKEETSDVLSFELDGEERKKSSQQTQKSSSLAVQRTQGFTQKTQTQKTAQVHHF